MAVTFAAFDVLWHDGELLTGRSYAERRVRLEQLSLGSYGLAVVPSFPGEEAAVLFRACDPLGVEGLVLKELAGTYQPGIRSSAWRKVKSRAWREHLERRIPRRG